jgi:hypothetical protein
MRRLLNEYKKNAKINWKIDYILLFYYFIIK